MADPLTAEYTHWEKYYHEMNAWYFAACRCPETRAAAYRRLDRLPHIAPSHLALWGCYDAYPARTVTHSAQDLFVGCEHCRTHFCTDAWRPYGYGSVYTEIHLTPQGRYRCNDAALCVKRKLGQ